MLQLIKKIMIRICGIFHVGVAPQDGKDGQDSVTYQIKPSISPVPQYADGVPKVENITVELYKTVGNQLPVLCGDYYWRLVYESSGVTSTVNRTQSPESGFTFYASRSILNYHLSVLTGFSKDDKTIASLTIPVIRDGDNGKDGEDAIVITLLPDINSYNKAAPPNRITVRCMKTVGQNPPEECSDYFISWFDKAEGRVDITEDYFAEIFPAYAREDNGGIIVRAYKDFKEATDWNDNYVAQTTISIIQNGLPGPAGQQGPLIYPLGEWNKGVTYTRTSSHCPFVYYSRDDSDNGMYYIPKNVGIILAGGNDPLTDAGRNWQEIRQIEYLFTKFLMANHALLAGAVAYNNKLFSQLGILNEVESNDYKSQDFNPYLSLDWKTGHLMCKKADVTGHIKATSGEFTGHVKATSGEFTGHIKATSGEFCGYLKTPFQSTKWPEVLSFESGFNFSGMGEGNTVYLPSAEGYEGVNCVIYVPKSLTRAVSTVELRTQGGAPFYYNGFNIRLDPNIKGILLDGTLVRLIGLYGPISTTSYGTVWFIENFKDMPESCLLYE